MTNQTHDQINKMFMESDIKIWREEIEIIDVEMIFYRNLIQTHLEEYGSDGQVKYERLFQGINDVLYYNKMYQKSFITYHIKNFGIAECDDLQCESFYFNEHAQLKESIEKHFSNYKQFKKNLFSYLKMRYNY